MPMTNYFGENGVAAVALSTLMFEGVILMSYNENFFG